MLRRLTERAKCFGSMKPRRVPPRAAALMVDTVEIQRGAQTDRKPALVISMVAQSGDVARIFVEGVAREVVYTPAAQDRGDPLRPDGTASVSRVFDVKI